MARLDESREGALIQVVDLAIPAERKSRPKRSITTVVTGGIALLLMLAFVIVRAGLRRASTNESTARKVENLRAALRGRRAT
jgi:uncharacterized protein involved in exopolysaccharide biosynthesis